MISEKNRVLSSLFQESNNTDLTGTDLHKVQVLSEEYCRALKFLSKVSVPYKGKLNEVNIGPYITWL